jgi:hypothetical protein
MASKAYWETKSKELSRQYPLPLKADEVYLGMLACSTVGDVLYSMAAGRQDLSAALLDHMVPRLGKEVIDRPWMKEPPEYKAKEMMMIVSEAAHVAWWLKTGEFDARLAKEAIHWREEMERLWGVGRRIGPNLLASMLLAVETNQPDLAIRLYEENAKPVLKVPPADFRFVKNARSVLYVFLRCGGQQSRRDMVKEALSRLLVAATKWEKDLFPLPDLGISDTARLVHACARLEKRKLSVTEVVDLIR